MTALLAHNLDHAGAFALAFVAVLIVCVCFVLWETTQATEAPDEEVRR